MKKTTFIFNLLLATVLSFAADESSAPAADVPTPAERQNIAKESPKQGQKEREDWKRMREERKQAREEILSKLRESPADERRSMRQNMNRGREERPRDPENFEPRPRYNDMDHAPGQNNPPPQNQQKEPPQKDPSRKEPRGR